MSDYSEKPLVPDFSMDGYSLNDARKKNDEGLCAFKDCDNEYSDGCYFYFSCKVCYDCWKPLKDDMDKWREEELRIMDKRIIDQFVSYFEVSKNTLEGKEDEE